MDSHFALDEPASTSNFGPCCKQLSWLTSLRRTVILKGHHSTWQHLSAPNGSSPKSFYNISKVQSNFYISRHAGKPPKERALLERHFSLPIDHKADGAIWLPYPDCYYTAFLSFIAGIHPDTNEDRLLCFFFVFFFSPNVIKWQEVNSWNTCLQIVKK